MGKKPEDVEVSDYEYAVFMEERPIRSDEQEWSIWYDRLIDEDPTIDERD